MDREVTTGVADALNEGIRTSAPAVVPTPLRGSVLVLIQFDVCEEIRLDALRQILGARTAGASFKKAPAYVRYQRPPVEETLEPLLLDSVERLEVQMHKPEELVWAGKVFRAWRKRQKGQPFESETDRDFATSLTQEDYGRAFTIGVDYYGLEAIIRRAEELEAVRRAEEIERRNI